MAELCRRLVIEHYAPAAVLVTRDCEVLYSVGPTDRYLRVAPGLPAQDLLAMARDDVRIKLRSAIKRACQDNTRTVVAGGPSRGKGDELRFSIAVEPVPSESRDLLLVCFLEEAKPAPHGRPTAHPDEIVS